VVLSCEVKDLREFILKSDPLLGFNNSLCVIFKD